MSQLIDQLQQLKTALMTMGEKYQATVSELTHLKSQPVVSQEQVEALQDQLDMASEHNQNLQQQLDDKIQAYRDLEQRYQSLSDSHSVMGAELERAQADVQVLAEQKRKLIDKNHVAAEHTKVVLERLAKIDSEA